MNRSACYDPDVFGKVWAAVLNRRALLSTTAAALATLLAAVPASTLAPQADPKFEQIAALVSRKMTEYGVPGVAVGIVKNGHTTVRGLGVTNLDNSQPVTPDTVFPLASISKTVTTTAMMRLVEQGKVDLNAPVAQYLPGFKVQDEAATRNVKIWLDPAQAIGHRGLNETMPDAPILAKQPDPAPYVGVYRRPPVGTNTVKVHDGQLSVDNSAIAFYAPDRAVVTAGNQKGNPVEFVRNSKGDVGWVRLVGRIARKD